MKILLVSMLLAVCIISVVGVLTKNPEFTPYRTSVVVESVNSVLECEQLYAIEGRNACTLPNHAGYIILTDPILSITTHPKVYKVQQKR